MLPKSITFVGFGLLASSMAMALKTSETNTKIRVVSSPDTLKRAKELGLADECFTYDAVSLWGKNTNLILLCSPILHITEMLKQLMQITPEKEILVSDIGSTKEEICKIGKELPSPYIFVGSHPMAGSEKHSLEFNDPSLFENAYWFVCPENSTKKETYEPLLDLIHFLGSHEVIFDAKTHDRTISFLSHMPQLLSSTLAASIPEEISDNNYQHFAGRAFKDMTRIAASSWNMWQDILLTNKKSILDSLDILSSHFNETIQAVKRMERNDTSLIHSVFENGNKGRASLFSAKKNTGHYFEITVPLQDKHGAVLSVIQPITNAGLQFREIELMKIRENISGTLLIAFKTETEANKAIEILKEKNIEAFVR